MASNACVSLNLVKSQTKYLILLADQTVPNSIKRSILKQAPLRLIHAVALVAFNTCRGSIACNDREVKRLQKYKSDLYLLSDNTVALLSKRKRLLTKCGLKLLSQLLPPALRSIDDICIQEEEEDNSDNDDCSAEDQN